MIQHKSPISGIDAYGTRYIATAGYDNQVILWDQATKTALERGLHDHLANHCKFSRCGKYLATAGSDYVGRLWEIPRMKLVSVFSDHEDDVERIAISPDSKLVATASRDNHVRLFDINGTLIRKFTGHEADVISVDFNMENGEIISSGDDATIRIWDIESGQQKKKLAFGDVETDTICIKDGVIYAGNDEGAIIVIDQYEVKAVIHAHKSGIKNIVCHPDYNLVMTCSYDYSIKLWQPDKKEGLVLLETIQCPMVVWLRASTIVNENLLAFGTFGDTYCTFNRKTGEWDLSGVQPTMGNNSVAYHAGKTYTVGDAGVVYSEGKVIATLGSLCNFLLSADNYLLTGGQAGVLFNALTGEVVYRHHSPLNCGAAFSLGNRKFVVIGAYTGEGIFIEINEKGISHIKNVSLHPNAIKGVSCNNDILFSVCATGSSAFHNLNDFSLIRYVQQAHDKIANGASVLPDGRFVSVSRDLKLRIWDSEGLKPQVIDTPHTHSIKCVTSGGSNGFLVATGSYNGRIAIYNLMNNEWVWVGRHTTSGISSLSYDKSEGRFLASSYDGYVYSINTEALGAMQLN